MKEVICPFCESKLKLGVVDFYSAYHKGNVYSCPNCMFAIQKDFFKFLIRENYTLKQFYALSINERESINEKYFGEKNE